MESIVILGASGFLGRAMISNMPLSINIKAVARTPPSSTTLNQKNVKWYTADLMQKNSINDVLSSGDIVVNLAYMANVPDLENIALIENIIEACKLSRASRLIHCSTAVVVGALGKTLIDETSPCEPSMDYEKTKLLLEKKLACAASDGLDIAILRPTAIVGSGGKNLLKLTQSLLYGSKIINYFKACLHGARPMHLVPVRNVVAALLHLANSQELLKGNVYIVSLDEDPNNNYISVERILLDALGLGHRKLSLIRFPKIILKISLKLMGRQEENFNRIYDSGKLKATNYKQAESVADAVRDFAKSIRGVDGKNIKF